MKKFLTLSLLVLSSVSLLAQNWYIRPGVGYTLPTNQVNFPEVDAPAADVKINGMTGDTTSTKLLTGNLGQGFRVGAAFGKMFNDNVGFEMGINFLRGVEEEMALLTITGLPNLTEAKMTGQLWTLDVSPSLIVKGSGDKWVPYARAGLFIPVGGLLTVTNSINDPNGALAGMPGVNYTLESTMEVKSQFVLGYQGAVGVNYQLSDDMSLFGEVHFLSFISPAQETEITEYEAVLTGVATRSLSDLSEYEKKNNFEEEITPNSNVQGNPGFDANKPMDRLDSFLNLSAVTVNIGITILL